MKEKIYYQEEYEHSIRVYSIFQSAYLIMSGYKPLCIGTSSDGRLVYLEFEKNNDTTFLIEDYKEPISTTGLIVADFCKAYKKVRKIIHNQKMIENE